MAEGWVEVKLGGYLKEFGRSHKFFVEKPADAIRALCMQVPAFERAMRTAHHKGIKFAIFNGKHNIKDPDELYLGLKETIRIIPCYEGRKSSFTQILVGALVIAAVVFAGPAGYGAGAWLAAGSTSAAIATSVGLSLVLGGVTQLLTPQQGGLSTSQAADNSASYAFGGPVNTTAQGQPVPVLYGEREVGGAVVSASIVAEDQS